MIRGTIKACFVSALVFLGGCATITGQNTQPISVQTVSDEGDLPGVACELENSKGKWFVTTPGTTVVGKASDDLLIMCSKRGFDLGKAAVTSKTNAGMWGNVLIGGGIGAVIDHNSGAAYNYPPLVSIRLRREGQTSTEKPLEPGSNPGTPGDRVEFSGNVALQKCKELGFSVGTPSFGQCVLKLSK